MPGKASEMSALQVRQNPRPGSHTVGEVPGLFLYVKKDTARVMTNESKWLIELLTVKRGTLTPKVEFMSNQSIIFDLDGTLLNTLQDLADSVNSVLTGRGWPEHPVAAYRYFVGDGLSMLIRRALPEHVRDQAVIDECVQAARLEYSRRCKDTTAPYPGVLQVLKELSGKGIAMSVLSNKPHAATVEVVGHFFPGGLFQVVQGALPDQAVKPHPKPALEVAARMGKNPKEIYFLGDSNVDMKTANSAGMIALGAAWGFRDREELLQAGARHILETPLELPGYF